MTIRVGYPTRENEQKILSAEPQDNILHKLQPVASPKQILALQDQVKTVQMNESITEYLMDIIHATRNHPDLLVGASPRAALALQRVAKASAVLSNRDYCIPDDVKSFAIPVLAHRIISKKFAHEPTRQSNEHLMQQIMDLIPVPG